LKKEGIAMNCKNCQSALPDLLLLESSASPLKPNAAADSNQLAAARAHLAACAACARELASLRATFALLDSWQAPEISPYFNQKLAVRLREEQAAPPAGWFERLKDRLLLNTGRQFRPALAASLALLLIVGGGSVGISNFPHSQPVKASATVNDLQLLDKNEQALQQMDQLLQDDASAGTDDNHTAGPPQS
jgi:hypothetical protein